jgi:hypothetical protein
VWTITSTKAGADISQRIVVVTGAPGAGKSTLSKRLAAAMGLPVFSLDAIKESLHDALGESAADPARLRFAAEAIIGALVPDSPPGAVLDIWLDPARSDRERLCALLPPGGRCCEVFCSVPAEVAVRRYATRSRHRMHGAGPEVLRRIEEGVRRLEARDLTVPDGLGAIIRVDATVELDLPTLIRAVTDALGESGDDP